MIVKYSDKYYSELIEVIKEMHNESRFKVYSFSERQIKNYLKVPSVFCSLALKDNVVIGFFIGAVQKMWFSDDYAGYDLALYINKEYRGGMYAVRLIKEFEKYCKENNCITINIGASAEISNESAKRLYGKLGYKECGFVSHKET